LNFCYDQKEGIVYSSDLETLEKLGIEREKISDSISQIKELQEQIEKDKEKQPEYLTSAIVQGICYEMIQEQTKKILEQFLKSEKSLKQEIDKLKNDKVSLERTISELVEFYQEMIEANEVDEKNNIAGMSTLKNSIGLLNKKIKDSNETIENLGIRFEAVLEMPSEQIAKTGELPNVMKTGMTLERIWSSVKDKNSAAILSIMFMMKKGLEDKGLRLSGERV
jgi:chromosome segregation ATPase